MVASARSNEYGLALYKMQKALFSFSQSKISDCLLLHPCIYPAAITCKNLLYWK